MNAPLSTLVPQFLRAVSLFLLQLAAVLQVALRLQHVHAAPGFLDQAGHQPLRHDERIEEHEREADGHPAPIVITAPYALFRADDWWQSRTTVREGLVELEKLALDFVRHPW